MYYSSQLNSLTVKSKYNILFTSPKWVRRALGIVNNFICSEQIQSFALRIIQPIILLSGNIFTLFIVLLLLNNNRILLLFEINKLNYKLASGALSFIVSIFYELVHQWTLTMQIFPAYRLSSS